MVTLLLLTLLLSCVLSFWLSLKALKPEKTNQPARMHATVPVRRR